MRAFCNCCRATFDVKEDLVDQEILCRVCGATIKQSLAGEPSAQETKMEGDVEVLDLSHGDDIFLMAEIFDATASTDRPQPSAHEHRTFGNLIAPRDDCISKDPTSDAGSFSRDCRIDSTCGDDIAISTGPVLSCFGDGSPSLIYVGLILLIAYGTYWHTLNHTGILRWKNQDGREGWYAIVYIAPIVAGVILLIFMIKPLFAWPTRREQLRSLTREEQPNLFDSSTDFVRPYILLGQSESRSIAKSTPPRRLVAVWVVCGEMISY